MQNDEYCRRLHEVKWTAGASARYHQKLEAHFRFLDKVIRVSVAVLAVAAGILAVPPLELHWWSFVAAVLAVIAAVALNVFTFVEDEKFHGEMFRAWSELRREAILEEHKTCYGELAEHHTDRLAELISKMESLNAEEPFPDVELQKKCEGDENESEFGNREGVLSIPSSASAASAEGPARGE